MTKTFIVGPFYYIPDSVREDITQNTTFIITDDVSPIFPLDTRMEWINYTFVNPNLELESMLQNEDSENFYSEVIDKISKLTSPAEEVKVILYAHTEVNITDMLQMDIRYITPPLEATEEDMDPIFATRFGARYKTLTQPKEVKLTYEEHLIVPYFTTTVKTPNGDITHKYYGMIRCYGEQEDNIIVSDRMNFGISIDETKRRVALVTDGYFGEKPKSSTLIGYAHQKPIWLVEINQPSYVDITSAVGLRKFLTNDADIAFVKDVYLRYAHEYGLLIEVLHKEMELEKEN